MARTYRFDSKKGKQIHDGEKTSNYYHRESKEVRVAHARYIRHQTRRELREGQFEMLPNYPHTGGWETY